MKYTLLEMTQRILGSMDSDEINTISQNTESLEVADIIKECYFNIVGESDLPEQDGIFSLEASTDNTRPVVMTVPDNVLEMTKVTYNTNTVNDPAWAHIPYVSLSNYLERANSYDITSTNVSSMTIETNGSSFVIKFENNRPPKVYTILNDNMLLFDAYESDVDSTLQTTKTLCFGSVAPEWRMEDTFVPDLDARQFQLLLQSSKAQAFVELKQIQNPKAEQKERKNQILAQRTKSTARSDTKQKYKTYGRK